MSGEFQVSGTSDEALFTLKLHRGEGMCLIAMNWKEGTPPEDFVAQCRHIGHVGLTLFFPQGKSTLTNRED